MLSNTREQNYNVLGLLHQFSALFSKTGKSEQNTKDYKNRNLHYYRIHNYYLLYLLLNFLYLFRFGSPFFLAFLSHKIPSPKKVRTEITLKD